MGKFPLSSIQATSESEASVELHESWYPKWAILQTAYLFFDRGYFIFSQKDPETARVVCRSKKPLEDASEKILGDFVNELVNTELREKLSEENRSIRESIFNGVMSMGVPKKIDQAVPKQKVVPPGHDKSIDDILKEIESELGLEDLKK